MRKFGLTPILSFVILCGAGLPVLSQIALDRVGGRVASAGTVQYQFQFENDRFTTPYLEILLDSQGQGRFRFRKKDGDDVTNDLTVSQSLIAEMQGLFDQIRFLDSTEDYQYKKDFSHLGKMTVRHSRNGKERSVTFNYTTNQPLNRIVDVFRNIATQETRVFEMEAVRESDPLSTPAQLRFLETELRSKQIAEPARLAPLLERMRTDESLPLIARNHAERLLKMIEKNK